MEFFAPVAGAAVLLYQSGKYFSSLIFEREDSLYAQMGKSFVKLHPSGNSSVSNLGWVTFQFENSRQTIGTKAGKLVIESTSIAKAA